MFNLTTVSTMFRPKKIHSTHTFLQTKCKEGGLTNKDKYIGREVKVRYKGKCQKDKVIEPSLVTSAPAWIVRFDDGCVRTYYEKAPYMYIVVMTS